MTEPFIVARELDARNLNCPLPLLSASSALSRLKPGEILSIVVTERGAAGEFARFSRNSGHELLRIEQGPTESRILLRRK